MKSFFKSLIRILALLFWILLMTSFSNFEMMFLTLFAAFLHEVGHVLVLLMMKKEFSLPRLITTGFVIKTQTNLSYKEEIIICGAGPMINLLLFVFLFPHSQSFAMINLATAISNLLPLPGYDGYKIINNVISLCFGNLLSCKIMPFLSLAVSSALVFFSLFFILLVNGGYFIFCIFFVVLVQQILFYQNKIKNENL